MKILVTGGGGFMGSWICRQLLAAGHEVIAFQRSAASDLAAAGVTVARGDIIDSASLEAAVVGCEALVHVAGKAGVWGPRRAYFDINVTGTGNVIAACRKSGIRLLVYTSSPSVVHGGGDIEGADESLPYPDRFSSPYPETKALAEQMVMAASDDELKTVSLRPHLIWGPGDRQLLPRLIERAAAGPLRLPGPDKLIDTVYVENAARAHVLALRALQANPACHGRTYFISNGEPLPQAKFISRLLRTAGWEPEIRPVSPTLAHLAGAACEWAWKITGRDSEPPVTRWSAEQLSTAHWYDISAARKDLGYQPEISIDEGIRRLAQAESWGQSKVPE